ncbi:hypothetical protein BGZ96_002737 [Linnemannia gamsii]|uniref:3-oxo-5-alpha-steroid 4-dehydrogenase C-terminal domain-containing protein n=1 Tax=Linnemannia gamsii TaxID=64522 RepID=A0ABQ7K9D6_9FUNG|nr:hypothetical protein BGZ96_002737 [Linnemannia gamsii]
MASSFYGFLSPEGLTSPVSSFALLNQIYFALATTAVIAAATLPFLRASILSYGKLDSAPSASPSPPTKKAKRNSSTSPDNWVQTIRSLQVPKAWFSHFYIYATLWMLYCAFDLWVYSSSAVVFPPTSISYSTKSTVIRSVPTVLTSTRHYWSLLTLLNYLGIMPAHIPLAAPQPATTNEPFIVQSWTPPPHVLLTMACYLLQVIRRWYESWFVERPSVEAKMHITHYIVGITFYSAMAPSTWIDAYEAWIKQGAATGPVVFATTSSAPPLDSMLFGLNVQCLLGLMVFIWANWHQYNCHVILAKLRSKHMKVEDKPKKQVYKVPFGDWFQYMVTPHYSAEMLIYLGLYLMASSSPLTANSSTAPTMLFACVWVVVNLGIVARETDQWYRTRFGDRYAAIGSPAEFKPSRSGRAPRRYILIPFIY